MQDVLYSSETQASLYLTNLVEGTYLFQLRVTDAQGRSSAATATVEVRPGGTRRETVSRNETDVTKVVPSRRVHVSALTFVPAVSP